MKAHLYHLYSKIRQLQSKIIHLYIHDRKRPQSERSPSFTIRDCFRQMKTGQARARWRTALWRPALQLYITHRHPGMSRCGCCCWLESDSRAARAGQTIARVRSSRIRNVSYISCSLERCARKNSSSRRAIGAREWTRLFYLYIPTCISTITIVRSDSRPPHPRIVLALSVKNNVASCYVYDWQQQQQRQVVHQCL